MVKLQYLPLINICLAGEDKLDELYLLRRLSTVCFVFVFFLSNDVRHEGASIFLPWTIR